MFWGSWARGEDGVVTTEVQFGGDYTAFPLWGRDENGEFDLNLPNLRGSLSSALVTAIDAWVVRWAEVDGGDPDDDSSSIGDLIAEARSLAARVGEELGADYVVSLRLDDIN